MGGVTLKARKVGKLKDYNDSVVKDLRMPLCANCKAWLEQIIKGNPDNFLE